MSNCPTCGVDNPSANKFCHECGSPLAATCAACGTVLPASQRFCGECGTPQHRAAGSPRPSTRTVPAAAAPDRAERRVCTVLFVDLVGFTPLSEALDAEDVRELLSRYFDRARKVVERHGGVIEKFIGDAVMAIWGTPVAREGDAERAVRAGLDLVAAVTELGGQIGAPELRARAGVVTGGVATTVGRTGEGVAGDTVNTAARVQTAATPGTVWVDDVTERITHAAIGYLDAGEHTLKGKAEPVHLWTATRVLSTVGGTQRVDGLEAPLLGRHVELRTIEDAFHAAIERGGARLVVVSGPAGIGKSRLGWEFEKYIDGLAHFVNWHRGRCLSYGDGITFWALAEAVRQRLGIAEEDSSAAGAAKLVEGVRQFVPDPAEQAYVGPRLARLLGTTYPAGDTGDSATLPRTELFTGWRLFLERLAAESPVVLVVEDAHHADTGLLDFLDHLVDWSRNAPIFVLVLARPELADRRPGWGTGRNRATITLETLPETVTDQLVDALVPGMPPATRAAVTAQAQGNPLYAVETIRSLIDRHVVVPVDGGYELVGDVSALAVPDTLRGLLAARFDALPASLRSLLSDAAVLGTRFPADALATVSGRDEDEVRTALDELLRREIVDVSVDPLSPQRGFYGFSQNLLRQVVYETLSRRDRKSRHLAVATHLRTAFADDGDEVIEAVAQHYVDALQAVPTDDDVDELTTLAVEALVRAADRVERAGAVSRAAAVLAAAADLRAERSGMEAAALRERAARLAWTGRLFVDAVDHARAASAGYDAGGDLRASARARVWVGVALAHHRRHDEARVELEAALEVLRTPTDADTVFALAELAGLGIRDARLDVATGFAHEAVACAQAVGVDRELMAQSFTTLGDIYQYANRTEEAVAAFEHAVRLSHDDTAGSQWSRARLNLADLLLTSDPARALTASQEALAQALRVGDLRTATIGLSNVVLALLWLGRWDEAGRQLERDDVEPLRDDPDVQQAVAGLAALRGDDETLASLSALPSTDDSDLQTAWYATVVETAAAAAAGDDARVVELVRTALAAGVAIGFRHETFTWSWTAGIQAAQECGDARARRELLDLVDDVPPGHLPPLVIAVRALARAVDRSSLPDLRDALAAIRAVGSPFHVAHALIDVAAHDPANAGPLLGEAVAINAELRAAVLTRRLAGATVSSVVPDLA